MDAGSADTWDEAWRKTEKVVSGCLYIGAPWHSLYFHHQLIVRINNRCIRNEKRGIMWLFYGKVHSIYMFYCFFLASWSVAWYWVLSKFGWWLILFSFWVLNKLAHSSFILKCSWRWELSFQWMLRIRDDWNSWSPSGQRTFQHYSGLKYDLARSRKPLASLNSFCFSFIVASSSCQESFWVAVEVKIMVLGVSYFADSVLWENISLFLQN